MEVTQDMRNEVVLHNWKMMKLDRCRATWTMGENYEFPNGIRVYSYLGKRPIEIIANIEQDMDIELLAKNTGYTKKTKNGQIEFSVPFGTRGEYLDLIWGLYTIGGERHYW